jgi:hypothetical protein
MKEARSAAAGGPGGLERAADLLREAWALSPSFRVACNRGRIAFRRGEMREAVAFLSICVAKTPAVRSAEERERDKRIEEALAVALKKVGALSVQVSEPGATQQVHTKSPAAPTAIPAAPPQAACPAAADQAVWRDAATVSFIAAGALAAGAVTLWMITGSGSQKPRSAAGGRSLTVARW